MSWLQSRRAGLAFGLVGLLTVSIAKADIRTSTHAGNLELAAQQSGAQSTVARQVGVIKSIQGNTIILTPDSGGEVTVNVAADAKKVRVAPGERDLKNATPIQLTDLHPGDRILVRGEQSADGKSFTAIGLIAMSQSDVAAQQQQEQADWQKHGIGGLVTSVDANAGTVAISVTSFAGSKTVVIHTKPGTILRRYAPESIRFDDAKAAPINRIQPGDQLRARGQSSADGTEFTADEIVSGTFRNIAGTVEAVDPAAKTVTVLDLIAKSPVVVRITDQSDLRNLPPEFAQRIALRMKLAAGEGANSGAGGTNKPGGPQEHTSSAMGGGQTGFQQILSRLPASAITDLKKGDAVMIVATGDGQSGEPTVITLLSGVDAILAAAPKGAPVMALSPWSLGGGIEGGEAANQ